MKHFTMGMHLSRLAVVCMLWATLAYATAQDLKQPVPLDPLVKTGVLSNGMKYYIRKNTRPEKRVELRLAINAGAILEDDDQKGLAHFTEHMCFNGTKNFKKNELVSYLQTLGVKFGADLNAYTSFDETVYILPIPADKPETVDKGLQVLEDWAHQVSFENEEIDKERGVIMEEWRSRTGAQERIQRKQFSKLFAGSRYPDRFPIGDTGIIRNFKHDVIKRFYRDWYRPDLMAVVVVGDIDVAEMEKKIQAQFGKIAARTNPRPRTYFPIPDHEETLISVAAEREAPFTNVRVVYKKDGKKIKTLADYREVFVHDLYNEMLGARLDERTKEAEPPFINAFAYYGELGLGFKNAYQCYASTAETGVLAGLKAMLLENKRALQFGFVDSELERAKKELLNRYERQYNERAKTESERLVGSYVQHFLDENPAPGIEFDFEFVKQILPGITLNEINALPKQWITERNRVIAVTMPEKDGVKVPTEADVLAVLKEVDNTPVKAYEDKTINEPLMATMPTAGKITAQKEVKELGATELTLSNGLRVIVKSTSFKDDEVLMTAYSPGGYSIAADDIFKSAIYADDVVNESGVSKFTTTDMQKMMTGKSVQVSPFIGELSEGFSGSAAPKDLETLFQLTHLYFTAPRKDEQAFKSYITKQKAFFKNLTANPQFYFLMEQSKVMSQNHPRAVGFPSPEEMEKVDLDKAFAFFQERFAEAGDFTFIFVGNVTVDKLKPFLENYLASLPTKGRKEQWRDQGIRPPKALSKEFKRGQDPRSLVQITYNGEASTKDAYALNAFAEVLSIKLIENLREEKGGIYGTGARANVSKYPYQNFSMSISFPCAPENVQKLTDAVNEEIKKIQNNGVTPEDLKKIQETQRKDLEKNYKENRWWLNQLRRVYWEGVKPADITEAALRKRIDGLNSKMIQAAAKKYAVDANRVFMVLNPEPQATTEAPAANTANLTVESVFDKYFNAIGGKAKIAAVNALQTESSIEVMGMSIAVNTIKTTAGKFYQTQKMPQGEMTQFFDGQKGGVMAGGQKQDLPAEAAGAMRVQAAVFLEMEYAKLGLTAKLGKTEAIDGKNTIEVVFSDGKGMDISHFYDLQTGLLVKYTDAQRQLIIKEYTEVEGIKLPKILKLTSQGLEMDMNNQNITVNPKLDDTIFTGQ